MFLLEVIHLCHDDGLLFSLLLGEVISSSWALSAVGSSSVSYSHSCSSSCSDSSWWSSSTCSIIIFYVDWAEVGYMVRGKVSSLNFVVSWRTVRCLIALPLFAANSSFTPRSRSFSFLTSPSRSLSFLAA